MIWIWSFILYSFLGFLLELAYACATGGRADRKCMLVLPLCPVYGLGACAILLLPPAVDAFPPLLFLLGGLVATGTEYLVAVFNEGVLGVSFWDYQGLPGNIQGRVCLPFSLAWSTLTIPLVYVLHPMLSPWLGAIPTPIGILSLLTLAADGLLSAAVLKRTGDRNCLRWYA